MGKDGLSQLSGWLVVIGALLWGLMGLTGSDVLASLGSLEKLVELVVGLAGLYVGWKMLGGKK